jgi:hypothetical protein
MSYLQETLPADTEAVTLGASRIRELKVELDTLIEQIFEDAGTFTPGWIKQNGAAGSTSMFTAGAIQSADIANNAIGTPQLNALSVTNAILAVGSVAGAEAGASSSLASGFTLPTASVGASQIVGASVGAAQITPASLTGALMAAGLIKGAAIGSYAGSNSASASVNSLGFNPNVVVFAAAGFDGFGVSFLAEQASGISPVHVSWSSTAIASPNISAVQWQAGGFIFVPTNAHFNQAGHTTYYFALLTS